ncbi:MAG: hypothetical protein ACRECP_07895, partial [Methylocella sp.]
MQETDVLDRHWRDEGLIPNLVDHDPWEGPSLRAKRSNLPCLWASGFERFLRLDHRVERREELAGEGNESDFVRFSIGSETVVESLA